MESIFKGWGEYPPEYNRQIHGPYNPSMYYGKRDTPFFNVKLGELGAWLGRRNKSPRAAAQAISRAWWTYQIKWVQPWKPGAIFIYQFGFAMSFIGFLLDYHKIKKEKFYRYH